MSETSTSYRSGKSRSRSMSSRSSIRSVGYVQALCQCYIGLLLLSCFIPVIAIGSPEDVEDSRFLPRIAIVGAGLGGTSSAYFLRQLFGEDVHIDIFEAEKVGGRTSLVDVDGHKYEAGASVIHIKNRYMVHFNELYMKEKSSFIDRGSGDFGLYGSDGMVFQTSHWTPVTLAKMFWRYGFDLTKLQSWVRNEVLPLFEKIYTFQENKMAFTTCEDLLRAMGDNIFNFTQYSMEEILTEAGLSRPIIQELGMAAMRNNYGQTTDVHGLVGAVSLVGTEAGLWSVIKGNKNLPEFLLKESKAFLIQGRVVSIALVKGDSPSYELDYVKMDPSEEGQTGTREYDLVFLAAPIHGSKNNIAFIDFPSSITDFSQDFHQTVAMFVKGDINKTTFHLDNEDQFPSNLFTVNKDLFFNSIGKQTPVDPSGDIPQPTSKSHVWKTFFNHIPLEEEINSLFELKDHLQIVNWKAYPQYRPKMDLPPFVLNEHLYYVNAIESAASALEMVAIGAKNTALLAYNHWYGYFDHIDETQLSRILGSDNSKSEL